LGNVGEDMEKGAGIEGRDNTNGKGGNKGEKDLKSIGRLKGPGGGGNERKKKRKHKSKRGQRLQGH